MSPFSLFEPAHTPLVILSEGCFGEHASKTATGVIRYGQWPIAAILDSTQAGQTVRQVTGLDCDAPIVATLSEALAFQPKALLIGTAPQGGGLPRPWREILKQALASGLHLISGLHDFLREDAELVALAQAQGVTLWDVRDLSQTYTGAMNLVALRKKRPKPVKVLTLVGSDCCVGKMVSALEIAQGLTQSGHPAQFLATGQTGILISGTGVPLDRMIGDFMAGHIERCLHEMIPNFPEAKADTTQWVVVEGQGSLIHPGYSGVTLSLLHGSNPEAMILCHNPDLTTIWGYDLPLPSLNELVGLYETAANWIKLPTEPQAKVVGICMNTSMYSEAEARGLLEKATAETGLVATDPIRFGVSALVSTIGEAGKWA